MTAEKIIEDHDVFVFDFEGVLYPEKDFLLQIYYLFGQFVEYSEQLDAAAILKYMQQVYLEEGHEGIFEKTAGHFGIDEKYKLNFDLLQRNVRLPLKLLIYDHCLAFLKAIVAAQKPVFLLVSGNPEAQLNKIRQVEWLGLEQYLTVYFTEEIETATGDHGMSYLIENHQLKGKKVLLAGHQDLNVEVVKEANITFFAVDEIIVS
ncbi:haloacid dehalogenase [Pedobacter sp.]|uniref:haloacid dehalogenase n=1 Tax=Pedobacter sp. TaxID=1411316 RepID=UPI003D7FF4C3